MLAIASMPAFAQTATGSIALAADGTYQIAVNYELNGLYIIDWDGPNRAEHYVVSVAVQQYDLASVQILNSTDFAGEVVFSNFRVVGDSTGGWRYFVADVANRAGGTGNMNVTAIGADAGLSLSATPGGSTPIANNVYVLGDRSGNTGIGTTSPGAKLEVNGNIKLTANSGAAITFQDGTTQTTAYTGVTCGGDYAESVDATGDRKKYEPGDVLVLDADHPGDVLKSSFAYSTTVAGIYSTRPGTVGRRQLTPKTNAEVPMAMVGVVPTKVTTEGGPIKVGDLLVSSSTPGYAMKGTDRSRMLGAVIGKAMGSLHSGKGEIEVLVSLQ